MLASIARQQQPTEKMASLLVEPVSLLANWAQEAERFAPDLKILITHPAFLAANELRT